jgi:proteasome lid subunit RPN8/RPN11
MRISGKDMDLIYAHASESYPCECFGFLLGVREGDDLVCRVRRGANVAALRPVSYEMDAQEFLAVDSDAERDGLEVIGFYHSHPDRPALPSQADLQRAWASSCYLIVSVHDWHPLSVTAWRLVGEADAHFAQITIELVDDGHKIR